eukprot:scaffold47031_cov47-Prasinocladus_malaysianus.AAC.2
MSLRNLWWWLRYEQGLEGQNRFPVIKRREVEYALAQAGARGAGCRVAVVLVLLLTQRLKRRQREPQGRKAVFRRGTHQTKPRTYGPGALAKPC